MSRREQLARGLRGCWLLASQDEWLARTVFLKVTKQHTAFLPCAPNGTRFAVNVKDSNGAFPLCFFDSMDRNASPTGLGFKIPAYLGCGCNDASFIGVPFSLLTPQCFVSTRWIAGELWFQIHFPIRSILQLEGQHGEEWTLYRHRLADRVSHTLHTPPLVLSATLAFNLLCVDHAFNNEDGIVLALTRDFTFEENVLFDHFGFRSHLSPLRSPVNFLPEFIANILETGCLVHYCSTWDIERDLIMKTEASGPALRLTKAKQLGGPWLFGHDDGYCIGADPQFPLNSMLTNPLFELQFFEGTVGGDGYSSLPAADWHYTTRRYKPSVLFDMNSDEESDAEEGLPPVKKHRRSIDQELIEVNGVKPGPRSTRSGSEF